MEIFQTIWTALTTENETLTSIFFIFLSFIEAYLSMLLFTTVLDITSTKKQKITYILLVGMIGDISKFIMPIIPMPFSSFINIISMFLLNIFIFKISILKSILALLVPIITATILESIFTKIYFSISHIDYLIGCNIPLHRLIVTSIIYICMYITYLLLKYFKINFVKLQVFDKRKKFLLIFSTIFGMILIGLQIYIITFYVSYLPFFITILNMLALIFYFTINMYTMFTVSKLETTSTSLEEAQLYNKTLEILQDNTRAFRHDFTNILLGMTGYMDKNDMDGLRKYHSQLLEDLKQSNNLTTLSPKVVNNPAIYNVLAAKYHKADSLGIKINLEVFLDLNDLHMKIYEFTRILGILMDNAIEATSECEEKIINVSIRKNSKKHMQILLIENTYKDKNIDTEKIYEKGFSTKKDNTGLGLWEIRQILKKNNNLNLYTTKNDEYFSQQFEIYY